MTSPTDGDLGALISARRTEWHDLAAWAAPLVGMSVMEILAAEPAEDLLDILACAQAAEEQRHDLIQGYVGILVHAITGEAPKWGSTRPTDAPMITMTIHQHEEQD